MPSTVTRQQNEVLDELLNERFPDLNSVRVSHPRGLVPVVLAQHLVLEEAKLEANQEKALGDAAALLDTAQQKAREIRFLSADGLSAWHRLVQLRRVKLTSVADRLVEAFEIAQQAGITLSISTGMVPARQDPDGGRVRYVLLEAASVVHATPVFPAATDDAATGPALRPGEGSGFWNLTREATLIAAGYIARHPEAAGEMPSLIEQIASALQTCGTLPNGIDDVPQFAGRLAKAMPAAPTRLTRHARVRRRVLDRKVPAGA